jgi:hypothetical protein
MPRTTAFKALVADLRSLLKELRARPHQHIQLFVNDLEASVERIQALKRQQIARQTASRQSTRQLAKAVADSRYTAGCLRSYLKACAEYPNEERFGITLARQRGSLRKACSASPKTQAN